MFDFSNNETVEDINTVPEQFRGAYSQAEDKTWTIADTAKGMVESISGLNKALTASRKEAKGFKSKIVDPATMLSELGEFDSVEAVKAHITGLQEAIESAGDGKVNLEKIKADSKKAIDDIKAAHVTEITGMTASLEKYMIDARATGALAKEKGNVALLMPHIRGKAKLVKEDSGDYVARIIDTDGDYRTDGKGGFMTVDDLVAEMKSSKDFAAGFESDAHQGGGARPGATQRPAQRKTSTEMTSKEKIAQGLAARGMA